MTPYQCFRCWTALKCHLTDLDYDIVRYQGKTKNTEHDDYDVSPHKHHFQRLSNHFAPKWMMLGVLLDNETAWIGDTRGDRADELCAERMGKAEALTYNFTQDVDRMPKDIRGLIRYEKGRHPPLMRSYLGKRISLETLTVMGVITGFPEMWLGGDGAHDVMVEAVARRALKYRTFLNIDREKFRRLFREKVEDRL